MTDLTSIHGLGPKKADILRKETSLNSIEDLFYYFPRRYLDRSITSTQELSVGQNVTLILEVKSTYLIRGRISRFTARCSLKDETSVNLLWFRPNRYIQRVIQKGEYLAASGKLTFFSGLQIAHPEFEIIDPEEEDELTCSSRLIPLYSSTQEMKKNHLDSRGLRRVFTELTKVSTFYPQEILPRTALEKHQLMDRESALKAIHFPKNEEEQKNALYRLKYEELFFFQMMMYYKSLVREKKKRSLRPLSWGKSNSYESLLKNLPFTLTSDQNNTIQKILKSCQEDSPCSFLLQGDVGSGKTVVALAVILHYTEAGIQTAFLAPTEILAQQHFITISNLVGLLGAQYVEILTGSDKKKEREMKLERIVSGEANIVIGTHSILEEGVLFRRLGLVIIDEQHRFGVKQRDAIQGKGNNPDIITMSATPIPRTLCLTEFADLELVTLKEKPKGRKPIQTMHLTEKKRQGLYTSIRNHLQKGAQCFIVYPLIEESEKIDLKAASQAYEELSSDIFPDFSIALLHGRLKKQEKEQIMNQFRNGKIHILITTTVIEVGVDIPNASVIVIEHAERFGISQLHQLRGRVGRGKNQSYCVLVSDAMNDESRARIKALVESNDGFYLAEKDLEIRGSGEILGLRQHGLSDLHLADLWKDRELAAFAYEDARLYPEISDAALEFLNRRFSQEGNICS